MIILASTSPTRQQLLSSAGIDCMTASPGVDEKLLLRSNPQWTPPEASLRLAAAKAVSVSNCRHGTIVVGADQVLSKGATIYGKPADREDCRRQLRELRGQHHLLTSSVVCAYNGTATWHYRQSATMTMRSFSDDFLERYLDDIGPACISSVGGYQLEGRGVQLFSAVDGDFFTILGLPLVPLLNYLRFTKVLPS